MEIAETSKNTMNNESNALITSIISIDRVATQVLHFRGMRSITAVYEKRQINLTPL